MKVGVLGSGDVGQALAKGLKAEGYDVMIATREVASEKAARLMNELHVKVGDFSETAAYGDILVICTLWSATEEVIQLAGKENFTGKTVIDTTNPLDFSSGMPPKLSIGLTTSAGEKIQQWLPKAHVVKAFNTVGNSVMYKPRKDSIPTMFIAGNHQKSKDDVATILNKFGWKVSDIGNIDGSRELESLCILWVRYGVLNNSWDHIITLVNN